MSMKLFVGLLLVAQSGYTAVGLSPSGGINVGGARVIGPVVVGGATIYGGPSRKVHSAKMSVWERIYFIQELPDYQKMRKACWDVRARREAILKESIDMQGLTWSEKTAISLADAARVWGVKNRSFTPVREVTLKTYDSYRDYLTLDASLDLLGRKVREKDIQVDMLMNNEPIRCVGSVYGNGSEQVFEPEHCYDRTQKVVAGMRHPYEKNVIWVDQPVPADIANTLKEVQISNMEEEVLRTHEIQEDALDDVRFLDRTVKCEYYMR